MSRRSAFRLIQLVSFLILINVGFYLFVNSNSRPELDDELADGQTHSTDSPPTLNDTKPTSIWCQYNECLSGRWIPRKPHFNSLAEYHTAFPARAGQVWSRCEVPPPAPGEKRTDEEQRVLEENRFVDVVNWVWQPTRGKLKDWDPEDFVVRLLQRPGGIIIIGDSISQQHEHAFGDALKQGGIEFTMDPPHLEMHDDPHVRQHILNPNHPMTRRLQERAGVPDSRLKYPIFTIIEEHMLIHEPEIRSITEEFGALKSHFWYHDFKRVEGWEQFVKNASTPRLGEEETVTADTVLLMNTGAHWSRGELFMLPKRETYEQEQSLVINSFRQMVRSVTQKLSPISRLSVFYRSTSPGHPNCASKTSPYHSIQEAQEQSVERFAASLDPTVILLQRRWDWDLFNIHNYIWKKEVARLQRERKALRERYPSVALGASWMFVDLWEISLKRPDAHAGPNRDCLHWCMPGLYTQWTHHIYHLLFLESWPTIS